MDHNNLYSVIRRVYLKKDEVKEVSPYNGNKVWTDINVDANHGMYPYVAALPQNVPLSGLPQQLNNSFLRLYGKNAWYAGNIIPSNPDDGYFILIETFISK